MGKLINKVKMETKSESLFNYKPLGNKLLMEVEFEASPIVYTDEKQFSNLIENSVIVVGIGEGVTSGKFKIGDSVHVGFNATTRIAVPEKFINNDTNIKPSLKDVIAHVKDTVKENLQDKDFMSKKIKSYAWFTVAEFDIAGLIVE